MASIIQLANINVNVAGRGSGKSSGKAWRYHNVVQSMPGCVGAIYSKTFKSLLTNTLSPVLEAMQRLGYHRGVHYVIGKEPPKDWPLAPNAPQRFDYYLAFRNGAGFRFMSEDREESFRGPSVDYIDADEGLLLNKTKFENGPVMANRGNLVKYRGCPLHHGISIDSSMPVSASGKWIMEFGRYYEDKGDHPWLVWNKVVALQYEFLQERNAERRMQIFREALELRRTIRYYRHRTDDGTTILFTFGNVFDNLENVGLKYITDAMRIMSPMSFRIEMLNQRITTIQDCFYNLNEDLHLYDCMDDSAIGFTYEFSKLDATDSRGDIDVNPNRQLIIGIDYGKHINALRCAQEHKTNLKGQPHPEIRFVKSLYVKDPHGIPELIAAFCEYYQHHKEKSVTQYYDHTAIGGENWRTPHIEETRLEFKKHGWNWSGKYIGKAPAHPIKHLLWFKCLSEADSRFPAVRFNRTNDKEGILAMQLAGVKEGRRGFEKDKSSEKSKVIPREQATDLTDAGDLILWGLASSSLGARDGFEDPVFG